MKSLSTAYMAKRYAKGGRVQNPKLAASKMGSSEPMNPEMCAHGGPIMCAEGCYAEGGEVSPMEEMSEYGEMKQDPSEMIEVEGDLNDEMDEFPAHYESESLGSGDENEMPRNRSSRLLGKVLGIIRNKNMGR